MSIAGIIAEYNPFHSGHLHQIRQVRRLFSAEYVIVVMSGDFVQRGEPAVYDKYTRTGTALAAGADLVLELPVLFATGSAEDFASAGVALLEKLGVTDMLCFGSEAGDLAPLKKAAELMLREPEIYQTTLHQSLKSGDSFPKAQSLALSAASKTEEDSLLSSPNNILGIEYIKALLRRGSSIRPVTIPRTGQDYHDAQYSGDTAFPSASALRSAIKSGQLDYFQTLSTLCPDIGGPDAGCSLPVSGCPPIFADDLTPVLNWKLLELMQAGRDLSVYAGLSPELASRLSRFALDYETFSGRIQQLKTRQYTYARISRALLHLLLDITETDIRLAKALDYIPYVRILGFRNTSAPLLSRLRRSCSLPLITKTADAREILDTDGLKIFEHDILASHLYQSLIYSKTGQKMPNEYTRQFLKL